MPSRSESVFPSFIYRGRLPGAAAEALNAELTREIRTLSEIDDVGRTWSKAHYPGGYSSYSSQAALHYTSPNFAELREYVEPHLIRFVRDLKWDTRKRPRMTTCWANAMGFGTHHTLHLHPLSVVSGVYYVNVPPGSSPLKLEDPRMGLFMASPPRKHYVTIEPRAGDFVLFESWMRHEVPPHRGRRDRLSISFNYEL